LRCRLHAAPLPREFPVLLQAHYRDGGEGALRGGGALLHWGGAWGTGDRTKGGTARTPDGGQDGEGGEGCGTGRKGGFRGWARGGAPIHRALKLPTRIDLNNITAGHTNVTLL
jgi:hypothetical protein